MAGKRRAIPKSVSIDDVNKKNVNNKNDISDMEPPFTVGLFFAIVLLFKEFGYFGAQKRHYRAEEKDVEHQHTASDKLGSR